MAIGSARASLHGGAASSASRGVLFGQLLRGGPARSGPIFDRLGPDGVAHIATMLSAPELSLLSALAFSPSRVERAGRLTDETLLALLRSAERTDADRLLTALPGERCDALRRALDGEQDSHAAGDRGRRRFRFDTGVGVVLRLRRLFRL